VGSAVCWRCIRDEYLKTTVREQGVLAECSLCEGDEENTFTASDLAELIRPIVREYFEQGVEVRKSDKDDQEWWQQEGEPLSHHVEGVIGQHLGFEDEIADTLASGADVFLSEGEAPFFDRSKKYVAASILPQGYDSDWDFVLHDLKHRKRFFNSDASALFSRLFKDVEKRQWKNQRNGIEEKAVWDLPEGSEVFRARICDSTEAIKDAYSEPLKHVGPPPPTHARAGRMNVEGVPVFYGAMDVETCLAEVRPALGNDTVVIKLRTAKPLRVLDFTRLEQSYRSLSYFQPDFFEEAKRGVFLCRLQRLISQPIIPGRESDYLITQTMTEYLAHVHETPFDGILFKSAQRSGGTNVVLFPNILREFPVTYVDESFKLFSTKFIDYKHAEGDVYLLDDELFISRGFLSPGIDYEW